MIRMYITLEQDPEVLEDYPKRDLEDRKELLKSALDQADYCLKRFKLDRDQA